MIIAMLVVAAYFPTFTGDFILDDKPLIRDNAYVREIHTIGSYLAQEDGVPDRARQGNAHTGYYRPLLNVTYGLDYRLWGMKAPGFRTTNLLLHFLNCLLVFHLMLLLGRSRIVAFWMTLFFALHPVATESVSWIASRNNILVTLFGVSCLYAYVRWWKTAGKTLLPISALLFALALLSKEFGVMVLPVIFLYQRCLGGDRRDIRLELAGYIPFLLILVVYFSLRSSSTGALLSPAGSMDLWKKIYFSPYIVLVNLRLVFLPYGLHSFIVQYPHSFMDWRALAGFVLMGGLALFIWRNRGAGIGVFSSLAFIAALFPVLHIVGTSAVTLVSMRWLYFPMVFLVVLVSFYFERLMDARRFLCLVLSGLLAAYFGLYTYILNRTLWHDEERFFSQEVLHFDNLFYAGGLAENLFDRGLYREAEHYFLITVRRNPPEAKHHINFAALLIETGRSNEALDQLNRAASLGMTPRERGEWWNNHGMALFRAGREAESIMSLEKAVLFCPDEVLFWSNLGGAYGSIGKYDLSVSSFMRGISVAKDSASRLRENLALTYSRMGDYEKVISVLEEIPADERQGNRNVMELLKRAAENLAQGRN